MKVKKTHQLQRFVFIFGHGFKIQSLKRLRKLLLRQNIQLNENKVNISIQSIINR